MPKLILTIAAALLLAGGAALAQTAPTQRIRGTIAAFDGKSVTVTARDGKLLRIRLADNWTVGAVKRIPLSDIKTGAFIGTAAEKAPDGALQALEVLVFPEAARGSGEGHYDWDLKPGSSMTNATVSAQVEGTVGRTLELTYKGGSVSVRVPDYVPIVTPTAADRADVHTGLVVLLTATKGADGGLTASRMTVEKDGVAPPM